MKGYWVPFWKVPEKLERQNKTMALKYREPDIMTHICYSSTWDAEIGGSP